jgi:Lrp/AsnC family transcriptional regulator, leucine-responsive regulatory protein
MKFREETFELDDIDRQLLSCLQEDAKVSLNRLGERVGLSAPSVMERIRKLEQAGIITGYHATLDARAVGLDVAAFIGVRVQSPVRNG